MESNYQNVNIDKFQSSSVVNMKSLMATVFTWMFVGLLLTTLTSLAFSFIPSLFDMMVIAEGNDIIGQTFFGKAIGFAPLILIFAISFGYKRMSYPVLAGSFLLFSAILGIGLSYIFMIYQIGSILTVFLSTCALFGIMAVAGYTTKADLTKLGSILFIGLIGIVIASLINFFMHSERMQYIISIFGVIIFTGLTAYDVQKIKEMAHESDGSESFKKMAVMGALNLYLDFINLFLYLLRLFGDRK